MAYTKLQKEAAKELLSRRKARRSIIDYANSIDVPGRPVGGDEDEDLGDVVEDENNVYNLVETGLASHHELLLNSLDEVSNTKHGRLMVFMPPGSAKSTYASIVFPSRYLGEKPRRRVILASYGDDLAKKMGRRTRSIIYQPKYKGIFGTELNKDSKGAQNFVLTNESEYMACGILAGVTGNRAHGIIIDDPVKGAEAAMSETIREKTFDAYNSDLKTRLIPGGWIVLVQTRWHEDDLAGRILPDGWNGESGDIMCKDGFVWKVICLQAECELDNDPLGRKRGEFLWPEWFDDKHWAQFKNSPRVWASLFQQLPAPGDGDTFKPDKLRLIDAIPAGVTKWVRGWDLASSVDGNWTVGLLMGLMSDGAVVIADVDRFRKLSDERDDHICNVAVADGYETYIDFPQDPGQAGKGQVLYLTRRLGGYIVNSSPESGPKQIRALPFASQVNSGNVYMVKGPWNREFKDEMRMFPNGRHDDQVDAASRAYMALIKESPGWYD